MYKVYHHMASVTRGAPCRLRASMKSLSKRVMRLSTRKRCAWLGCSLLVRDLNTVPTQDAETTYFNDSAKQAKQAVDTVLQQYQDVLQQLNDDEVRGWW